MDYRELDDAVRVSGQIGTNDVAAAAEAGIAMIVNNRPDGEAPGQPTTAELQAAAEAAGIAYRHIPISDAFSGEKVAAMTEALASAEGPVLVFCTSGTRSAYLWALARAQAGADARDLMRRAAEAGYNLRPIAPWLKPR